MLYKVIEKKLKRFLISLSVGSDGKIKGSAAGRNVTGDWDWIDGFFCRTLLPNHFYLNPFLN